MNKKIKIVLLAVIVVLIAVVAATLWFFLKKDDTKGKKIDVSAAEAITSFDGQAIDNSFTKLDYYTLQPSLHEEAAQEAVKHIQDKDQGKRFAAIYLLTLTGDKDDRSELAKVLEDENKAYATVAAGTLIGWGDKNAIPILIESLSSKDSIPYSDPPTSLAQLAYKALPYYTGKDFGLTAAKSEEEINNAQAEYKMWWSSNNEKLQWDEAANKYIIK